MRQRESIESIEKGNCPDQQFAMGQGCVPDEKDRYTVMKGNDQRKNPNDF